MENMTASEVTAALTFWTRQLPDSRNSAKQIRDNIASLQFTARQIALDSIPIKGMNVNEGRALGRRGSW